MGGACLEIPSLYLLSIPSRVARRAQARVAGRSRLSRGPGRFLASLPSTSVHFPIPCFFHFPSVLQLPNQRLRPGRKFDDPRRKKAVAPSASRGGVTEAVQNAVRRQRAAPQRLPRLCFKFTGVIRLCLHGHGAAASPRARRARFGGWLGRHAETQHVAGPGAHVPRRERRPVRRQPPQRRPPGPPAL